MVIYFFNYFKIIVAVLFYVLKWRKYFDFLFPSLSLWKFTIKASVLRALQTSDMMAAHQA